MSLSQIFGDDRIVEEFVIRFTHTLRMDWMLPGVAATNRKVEFVLLGIVGFQGGKVASEPPVLQAFAGVGRVGRIEDFEELDELAAAAAILRRA